MTKLARVLAIALALLAPPLASQRVGLGVLSRLMDRHIDSLQRDTMMQRLSNRPQGFQLSDMFRDDMLLRLSDSDLVEMSAVILASLDQVDSSTCARYSPGGADFDDDWMALAALTDSMTAERWMKTIHKWMLTGIYDLPRGRILPRDSVVLSIAQSLENATPAERAQLAATVHAATPSRSGRCAFAKYFWRSLTRMPPEQAGPMLRGLMARALPQ